MCACVFSRWRFGQVALGAEVCHLKESSTGLIIGHSGCVWPLEFLETLSGSQPSTLQAKHCLLFGYFCRVTVANYCQQKLQ